jgi:hypothetical protein
VEQLELVERLVEPVVVVEAVDLLHLQQQMLLGLLGAMVELVELRALMVETLLLQQLRSLDLVVLVEVEVVEADC